MKKPKIVFIIPNMGGGGTERVISLLSSEYIRQGYPVAVMQFAGYKKAYELDPAVEDFSISAQSKGNPFVYIGRIIRMRRYWKANPDAYIFAFCVMGAICSVVSTIGMHRRILVAERSSPESCNIPRLRDWAYRRAQVIVFQTKYGTTFFDKKIVDKAVVIPNPVVLSDTTGVYTGIRTHRVVTVGRLFKGKNQEMLLRAFADFHREYPDYELHVYGNGDMEEQLKGIAADIGISEAVVWHGFCRNVQEEIRDSRMFVLSSDYEGISNSMLEALALGIPVISTDCPIYGAREYIKDGENGLLIPVGDGSALSAAMKKIAGDDVLAQKFSINGALVRNRYGIEIIADRFLEVAGII